MTQEVFVRVHRKLWTFRGDGSFDAWLYRITRRVVFRMRPATPAPVEGVIAADPYITDPGARIDRQRAVALIQTIAATLPMRQREVFVLCDIEERTRFGLAIVAIVSVLGFVMTTRVRPAIVGADVSLIGLHPQNLRQLGDVAVQRRGRWNRGGRGTRHPSVSSFEPDKGIARLALIRRDPFGRAETSATP